MRSRASGAIALGKGIDINARTVYGRTTESREASALGRQEIRELLLRHRVKE